MVTTLLLIYSFQFRSTFLLFNHAFLSRRIMHVPLLEILLYDLEAMILTIKLYLDRIRVNHQSETL